ISLNDWFNNKNRRTTCSTISEKFK
ncbi:unnamed protein product, partial [Rotaria magnacalcarata]